MCHCWKVGQVFIAAVWLQVKYHSTFDFFCFSLPVPASGISLSSSGVCHDKRFVTKHILLSQQNTSFVKTKVYLLWQNYVCHDKLLQQTCICCDIYTFLTTKDILSQQTCLSWQKCACHNKTFVANFFWSWQNVCRDKHKFVATSILLYGRVACQQFDLTFPHTCLGAGTLPCPLEPVFSYLSNGISMQNHFFINSSSTVLPVLFYQYCVTSTVLPVLCYHFGLTLSVTCLAVTFDPNSPLIVLLQVQYHAIYGLPSLSVDCD